MMRLALPLVLLAAGLAVLLLSPAETRIFGLDNQGFAWGAAMVAFLAYFMSWLRPSDLARAFGSILIWAAIFVGVVAAYAFRYDMSDFVGRITSEIAPSEPVVGKGGEVIVNRRLDGEFAVAATVDGARVTFLFDTGASVVVLSAEDAERAKIETRGLRYDVPVSTANGSALAADTRIDEIAIGPIVMRNVHALIAKPGALEQSLLGMSFLERLKSYAVQRNRLILSAQ